MRNPALSMRLQPRIHTDGPMATAVGRVLVARQSLAAASARHFPDDGTVDFTAPAVTLTEPGRPKVSLEAVEGTLSGDRETIVLRGKVRATQEAATGGDRARAPQGPITMTTEWLRLQPKKGAVVATFSPHAMEGVKTIAYEVCEQLGGPPDRVSSPGGPPSRE